MSAAARQDISGFEPLRERFGQTYQLGQEIFQQGDAGGDLFIVMQGAVEFDAAGADGERHPIRTAGPGELFGEMSCFGDRVRSATATALQETTVLRLNREAATQLVEARPAFAMLVIRTLAERLRASLGASPTL